MSSNPQPPLTLTLPQQLVDTIAAQAAALVLEQLSARHAPESPYLTIAEAATYLRCKRQRIDDLLSARRLRRYKDGRRTLLLRADLDAYLAHNPTSARHPTTGGDDWIPTPARATVTDPGNRSG